VLFTNAPKMLNELSGAEIHGALDRVMQRYVKAELLVIDDFAVLAMAQTQATSTSLIAPLPTTAANRERVRSRAEASDA
jgi:DNA replication protein DnaC